MSTDGQPSYVDLILQKFTPVRCSTSWIGEETALDEGTKQTMAAIFGAKGKRLKGSKSLFNLGHPLYLACTSIRSQAKAYLKRNSRAFEGPVRLVLNEDVEEVHRTLLRFGSDLEAAAMKLQNGWEDKDKVDEAGYPVYENGVRVIEPGVVDRTGLGELYDSEDYRKWRDSIAAEFAIRPLYPSISAPESLNEISDAAASYAYAAAQRRIESSLVAWEEEMAKQFIKLVKHFKEMMGFDDNGNPRRFQNATVDNLNNFFEQFRRFDIGSSPMMNAAVDEAQRALGDTGYTELKNSDRLRRILGEEFGEVEKQLETIVTGQDVGRMYELDT